MTAGAADPAAVLQRRLHPSGRLRVRDLAFRAYVAALVGPALVIWGEHAVVLAVAVLGLDLPVAGPERAAAATLLAAALAGVLAAAVNTGAWRAPLALDEGDVTWLLASPLPRDRVLRPRLERSAVRAGGWAAAAGAVAGTVLAQVLGGPPLPVAAAAVVGAVALACLAVAAAWWPVLRVGRGARALRGSTLAGGALVGLAALALAVPAVQPLLLWSGPWGWVAQAIAATAEGSAGRALALLAASGAAAGGALRWVAATAGSAPTEELRRRAVHAARAAAAGYLLDSTALVEARRDALDAIRPASRIALPPPRRPALAVAWRDATALLRAPGRNLAALVAGAAGGLAGLAAAAGPLEASAPGAAARTAGAVVAAAVVGQVAARLLLAPLRTALAWPFGHAHLPWGHAALVRRHVAVPAAATMACGLAGVVVAAVATASAAPLAALPAVALAVPLLVLSAATQALQPPPEPGEMAAAAFDEYAALRRSLEAWPRLLVLAVIVVAGLIAATGAVGTSGALAVGLGSAVPATAIAWWRLGRRTAPWEEPEA